MALSRLARRCTATWRQTVTRMTPTILRKLRIEVGGEGRRPHLDLGPGDQAAIEAAITLTPRDSAGIFRPQWGANVAIVHLTTRARSASVPNTAWKHAPQVFTTHGLINKNHG